MDQAHSAAPTTCEEQGMVLACLVLHGTRVKTGSRHRLPNHISQVCAGLAKDRKFSTPSAGAPPRQRIHLAIHGTSTAGRIERPDRSPWNCPIACENDQACQSCFSLGNRDGLYSCE